MSDGIIPEGYRVYPPSVNMYTETVGRMIAGVAERAVDAEFFHEASHHTPRRRLCEAAV